MIKTCEILMLRFCLFYFLPCSPLNQHLRFYEETKNLTVARLTASWRLLLHIRVVQSRLTPGGKLSLHRCMIAVCLPGEAMEMYLGEFSALYFCCAVHRFTALKLSWSGSERREAVRWWDSTTVWFPFTLPQVRLLAGLMRADFLIGCCMFSTEPWVNEEAWAAW